MDFVTFAEMVKDEVGKTVGSNFQIRLNDVRKNNGIILKGITVVENDNNIAPTIYLNNYYKDYVDGKTTFVKIIDDLMCIYHKNKINQSVDMRHFLNYEKVKQRIVYKLINTEKNKELLNDIPHIDFLDLSIVFQYLVTQEDLGMAAILIHNVHQKLWGVSVEDLYQAAKENTHTLLKYEVKSMSKVLCEIREEEGLGESEDDYMMEISDSVPMYVLTNKQRVEGAACMLYSDLLHHFSDKIGKNLFIIPSSIHELLLLPADHDVEALEVKRMIKEINDTQVSTEEILSYSLYFYDRQVGKIVMR